MTRPLRIEMPDGVYHITSRGLERRAIVRANQDRQRWTSLLGQVAQRRGWRVFAWVLMDNHFHIFLRTPHADLSAGMHDLNSGYVTSFNRRHKRSGPLFQGRFKSILVERDYHYWELSRYIHLNPVRAKMVDRPETYPWSSCRFYFHNQGVPDWLALEEVLCQHGRMMRSARQEYKRFLNEGLSSPPRSPLGETIASTILGSPGFVDQIKSWLQDRLPDREIPATRQLRHDISIGEIEEAVCSTFGVSKESLKVRGRRRNQARAVAVYLCRMLTRMSIEKIGAHFGRISGQAISNIVAKVAKQRQWDKKLDSVLDSIEKGARKV